MRKASLECVYELAKVDPRVIFIGSDLGPGVLDEMKNEMPDRFLMEGVAEQHIVGMAAGLAMEGYLPFVNTIATFLTRRCFEQVAVDLCLHDLPVRLIANGGGTVYAPLGPTHLAIEDIALMRSLPNMTVVAVCDAEEMKRLMKKTISWPHPMYIRLAKGGDKTISKSDSNFEIGKAILMKDGKDATIISTGIMTQKAIEASDYLASKGLDIAVLHVHTIKPLDTTAILEVAAKDKPIVTVEEHIRNGGLGSAVLEKISDFKPRFSKNIKRLGLPDKFPDQYGSQSSLLERYKLTTLQLSKAVSDAIEVR